MKRYKPGDLVVFLFEDAHKTEPECYPEPGTLGRVLTIEDGTAYIQWEIGRTSSDNRWWAPFYGLRPATEEEAKHATV